MFAVGVTVVEPETPEALKPLPVQLVVFVEDQVSIDDWPGVTDDGDALSVAVGVFEFETVTLALALAEPPAPVHVML